MNELTITLTGQKAEAYTNMMASFAELCKDNSKIVDAYEDVVLKYDKLVDEHNILKAEVADLVRQLDEIRTDLYYKQLKNSNEATAQQAAEAIIKQSSQSIDFIRENHTLQKDTDSSEKDTTISEIIKLNPVTFPATTNKPKRGTHWTEDELDVISRSLESNYTLAFIKVKLPNRSEAAIRSMLLNYGIGVKNNKLYAK